MTEKTRNPLEASADGDEALLAQYGFAELPVQFAMRDGNNMIREQDACYRCAADGFYGKGTSGTWYEEGSIIVMDITPNYQTEPLNRAAALKWAKWAASLPTHRASFDIGDMAEASQILAKNPDVQKLDPIAYQTALIKLCEELKIRRDGKDARSLPGLAHNFASQSGQSGAPPILGAKVAQMANAGPGSLHGAQAPKGGVRRASPASPIGVSTLGGLPPTP